MGGVLGNSTTSSIYKNNTISLPDLMANKKELLNIKGITEGKLEKI